MSSSAPRPPRKRASAGSTRADDGEGVLGSGHGPVGLGFLVTIGALLAIWLGGLIMATASVLVLIVVSMFIAIGLDPLVTRLVRRGLRRGFAVTIVISGVLAVVGLFVLALVPVIVEQVAMLIDNVPQWLDDLGRTRLVMDLDERYDILNRTENFLTGGKFVSTVAGGAVGFGFAVLSVLLNAFVVLVLTLYFLASLEKTKQTAYRFVPASRRARFTELAEHMVTSIGGYVSGAFVVAVAAGVSSFVFLLVVGLGQYAVALSMVVAVLSVIPMIGATIGSVIVTAIGFATDPKIGLACLIFYVIYQQVENYVIYPRVMSRSVNVPGIITVIAALVGAALMGVIGAMFATPVAAAVMLICREVVWPKQDSA